MWVFFFFRCRYYRPIGRNYRWNVPDQLPEATSAYEISVLDSGGSGTGTCPGTTGINVITGLPAEVPPRQDEAGSAEPFEDR